MLKRNIVVQAFVVVLLTIGTNTFGALIDMTFADQHVFGETGYKIDDPEYIEDIDLSLEVGLGNFDLEIPLDNFGVSISPLLHSRFLEDQTIEVIGSSHASAEWGKAPLEADDIHGGGVSEFALYFARESSPVYFQVNGQINFDMESHTSDYPEMLAVWVRLQSVNSGTIIWEDIIYEGESGVFVPFSHGLWLDIDEIYELSAFAGAGVGITPGKTSLEPQSHNALFSFTATVTEGDPAHIYIAPDTISTRTKTITCYIWPPEGYDVTEIVQRTIRLDPEILPDRISVHSNQQMLVVKFPTAGLNLGPDPERVLTVTGVLTDGTRFEDSDIVEVVQRGGKPN